MSIPVPSVNFLCLLISLLFSGQLWSETLESVIADFSPTSEEKKAGAAILRYRVDIDVQERDQITQKFYLAVAILDQQASSDYSRIRESFNSYYDSIKLKHARLIDADGRVRFLDNDAVQIKTNDNGVAYDDIRTLAFSMPAVSPGSFLEYEIELKGVKAVMPGYWYKQHWFNSLHNSSDRIRIDPIRHASLNLVLPAEQKLNISTDGDVELLYDREEEGRRRLLWEVRNLPGIVLEDDVPDFSALLTHVELSNIPDWETVNRWAGGVFNNASVVNEEISNLVSGLIKPEMNEQDKIESIFYWVQQNIRYIGADLKRGGIIPHSAAKVLSSRFGDCKDQAVLLVGMMREAGIEADQVLISPAPASEVNQEVPSLRFNHMIVRVKQEGKAIWLDTSGDAGAFPGIDPSLEGRLAFVIDNNKEKFFELPESGIDDNVLKLDIDFRFSGDDLRADVRVQTKGVHDYRFKRALKNNPEFRDLMRNDFSKLYSSSSHLDNFKIEYDDSPKELLEITGELVFPDKWSPSKREAYICNGDVTSALGVFSHLLSIPDKPRRYEFKSGIPARFQMRTRCPSPGDSYRPNKLTGDVVINNPNFHYIRNIAQELDGVEVKQEFILKGNVIAANDYLTFRRDIRDVVKQSSWLIGFERDDSYGAQLDLKRKLKQNDQDHQARIELARQHMAEAEYELAQEMIRHVIENNPSDGEAHYLHGLVLGMLDQFEESDMAFKKAEELGYRP